MAKNIGMMWLDDSKDPLEQKILRAAQYYAKKYGKDVRKCYVPIGSEAPPKIGEIRVLPSRLILKHHLWLLEE